MPKRKSKTYKAEELFYRVSLRKSFQEDLYSERERLGIPIQGFKRKKDLRDYLDRTSRDFSDLLGDSSRWILEKYRLPLTLNGLDLLDDYLLSNNKMKISSDKENEDPLLGIHSDDSCVYLEIYPGVSLEGTYKYIQDNWKYIKKLLQKCNNAGVSNLRIKSTVFKKRNELVYKEYRKTRKELNLQKGEYKDLVIAKIMKEKYGYSISPENVRKIVHRQKISKRDTKGRGN